MLPVPLLRSPEPVTRNLRSRVRSSTAVTTSLLGRLMDRRGPRLVVEIGVGLVAAGSILASMIRAPWHLHATLGVLVGGGSICLSDTGEPWDFLSRSRVTAPTGHPRVNRSASRCFPVVVKRARTFSPIGTDPEKIWAKASPTDRSASVSAAVTRLPQRREQQARDPFQQQEHGLRQASRRRARSVGGGQSRQSPPPSWPSGGHCLVVYSCRLSNGPPGSWREGAE